jgi:hypothetical protein
MTNRDILKGIVNSMDIERLNSLEITSISFLKDRVTIYSNEINVQIPYKTLEKFADCREVE